jgi:hypothetical protein
VVVSPETKKNSNENNEKQAPISTERSQTKKGSQRRHHCHPYRWWANKNASSATATAASQITHLYESETKDGEETNSEGQDSNPRFRS